MNFRTTIFVIVLVSGLIIHSKAGSCGLQGIPNTSIKSPYRLPPVPNNIQNIEGPLWEITYTGSIIKITTSGLHKSYLSAKFSTTSKTVRIFANNRTKNFAQDRKRKEMLKIVNLKCADNTTTKYHLKIPLWNMTPPDFIQEKYRIKIPFGRIKSNFKLISIGQVVFFSDNPIDCELDPDWLRFVAEPDIIRVKAHPMWINPFPALYYYRLDIYLKDDAELTVGQTVTVDLSEVNEFNSRATELIISVAK